jgi:histidinol-phosphate phosphatase family protein
MRLQTVFLDRDGVINRMRGDYVKRWEELELLPGALDALRRLTVSNREVIVVTNQSAVGQKLVAADAVDEIHSRLAALVAERGGRIRAFLICPHTRDDGCDCRKPAPGLLFQARDTLGVNLADAVMVGDQIWDIQAARIAGCEAILIDPAGSVASRAETIGCSVVADLGGAVDVICGQ